MADIYARTLRLAGHLVGGVNELAARLSVPGEALALWLTAREPVPLEILLRAVDIVVSHGLEQIGDEPTLEMPLPTNPDPEPGKPAAGVAASHDGDEASDEPTIELARLKAPEAAPKKPQGELDEPTIEIHPPRKPGSDPMS
jgi:hypothetical protein